MIAHDLIKLFFRLFRAVFGYLYFYALIPNKQISVPKKILAALILLSSVILNTTPDDWPYITVSSTTIRQVIYTLIGFLYLSIAKEGNLPFKLYYTFFYMLIHTSFTNLFMISPLTEIRTEKIVLFQSPILNICAIQLFELGCLFVLLYFVRKECDFSHESHYNGFFSFLLLTMTIILTYMKQTSKIRNDNDVMLLFFSETSLYYYALILLSFVILITMERYKRAERYHQELARAITVQKYEYQALVERERLEHHISCLRHDMKNHLLAIRNMVSNQEDVTKYIDDLQSELDQSRILVETGNPMINGLLSSKLKAAASQQIQFNINMDLRDAGFLKPMDLCTIIANALDNAIEASVRVPDPSKRRIHIKASSACGYMHFRFMNYFEQELIASRDTFLTSKPDKKQHGLGLISIRYTVGKYEGTVTTTVDEDHYFILAISIPIAASAGRK